MQRGWACHQQRKECTRLQAIKAASAIEAHVATLQINALQAQNQRLVAHVGEVEAHKGMLTGQVTTLRSKWTNATNDNMRLQAELGTLRKTLQVSCVFRLSSAQIFSRAFA